MLDRLTELREIAQPRKAPKKPAALKRYIMGKPYRDLLEGWEVLLQDMLAEESQPLEGETV